MTDLWFDGFDRLDGFDGFDKLTASKLTAGKRTASKRTASKLTAGRLTTLCPAKAGSRGNPGLFEIGSSSFGSELLIQFPGTIQALGTQKMTQDTPNRHTPLRRLAIVIVGYLLIAGLAAAGYVVQDLGYRATGYTAKQACSLVNFTGQPLDVVLSELQEDNPLIQYVDVEWNPTDGTVHAGFFGLFLNTAKYRPPLGAVLVYPGYEAAIEAFPRPDVRERAAPSRTSEPFLSLKASDDSMLSRVDKPALARALAYAFGEPADGESTRRTRALLVIWHNRVIAEQYHPDAKADSLFLGWSMSKSILSLAIGRRIHQGVMSLEASELRSEWLQDHRRSIRLEQLLRMESGLKFSETYSPFSDVLTMLYRRPDMGGYAASFEREAPAGGSPWLYSSGTTNILSHQLRRSFDHDTAYVQFLWDELLLPIGIHTAQLEFDASGTWVASSYVYATARDWARFGKWILDDGLWEGRRLLPVGWIQQSMTPTPSYRASEATGDPPGASYGMQWWLNRKNAEGVNWMPLVPGDMITAWGHFHQYMTVIPSRQLIVVRLGLSKGPAGWDYERFLSLLLSALPDQMSESTPQK